MKSRQKLSKCFFALSLDIPQLLMIHAYLPSCSWYDSENLALSTPGALVEIWRPVLSLAPKHSVCRNMSYRGMWRKTQIYVQKLPEKNNFRGHDQLGD